MSKYIAEKIKSYRDLFDTVTIDNSSLCLLEECQRKFLYRSVLFLREPEEKIAISFGKAMHKFLELHYANKSFEESFAGFCETALKENTRIAVSRVNAIDVGEVQEYSLEFGYVLCKKYFNAFPLDREYFTVLKDTQNIPYTETGFALDLPHGVLVGLIDLLGTINYNNNIAVIDHKTTKHNLNQSWLSQFTINNQISTYLYAASDYLCAGIENAPEWITTAIINALRVKDYRREKVDDLQNLDEEKASKLFQRLETSRSIYQLEQRIRHADYQLMQIGQSLEYGIDGFPQHTQSCNTKYGDCEYQRLCMAKDEKILEWLMRDTYKVERWLPYEELQESGTGKVIEIDVNLEDRKKDKVDLVDKTQYINTKIG